MKRPIVSINPENEMDKEEIEITPEMIEAGAEALRPFTEGDSVSQRSRMAEAVLRAALAHLP